MDKNLCETLLFMKKSKIFEDDIKEYYSSIKKKKEVNKNAESKCW